MHEISIIKAIIESVDNYRIEQNLTGRISQINLLLGGTSCLNADNLKFGFAATSKEEFLSGCKLNIETKPQKVICNDCVKTFCDVPWYEPCPDCGGMNLKLEYDDSTKIQSFEIEEEI